MKKSLIAILAITTMTSAIAAENIKINNYNFITSTKDTSKYKEVTVKQLPAIGNFPAIKGEKVDHYVFLYGVKCQEREATLLSIASYNTEGKVISSKKVHLANKMWTPVDTTDQYGQPRITQKIADAVCK